MNRIFLDMDGVLADFAGYKANHGLTSEQVKQRPGAYLELEPYPGGVEGARSLIGMGYEVWIATKPPTGVALAYADKAAWVLKHLPELKRRIIITHDKGLLGDAGDYLVDDRPHKANCVHFRGTLLPFGPHYGFFWPDVLDKFRGMRQA